MCGIAAVLTSPAQPGEDVDIQRHLVGSRLQKRGPDASGTVKVSIPSADIFLSASLLQLRGLSPEVCPLTHPTSGSHLCFNGEIFGGALSIPDGQNDGRILLDQLCHPTLSQTQTPLQASQNSFSPLSSCRPPQLHVPAILSTLQGPWSLIFWDAQTKTLWFGRDVLGLRSLLIQFPSSHNDQDLILTSVPEAEHSVSPTTSDNSELIEPNRLSEEDMEVFGEEVFGPYTVASGKRCWQEVPPGLYCLVCQCSAEMVVNEMEGKGASKQMERSRQQQQGQEGQQEGQQQGEHGQEQGQHMQQVQQEMPQGQHLQTQEQKEVQLGLQQKVSKQRQQEQQHQTHHGTWVQQKLVVHNQPWVLFSQPWSCSGNSLPASLASYHRQQLGTWGAQDVTTPSKSGIASAVEREGSQGTQAPLPHMDRTKAFEKQRRGGHTVAGAIAAAAGGKTTPLEMLRTASSEPEVQAATQKVLELLEAAVKVRCLSIEDCQRGNTAGQGAVGNAGPQSPLQEQAPVLVLFSGGVDSTLLAALLHKCLPAHLPIDLSTICFDKGRSPDRLAARSALAELSAYAPHRQWRLIEVDASLAEVDEHKDHLLALLHPANTIMDLNIGAALWLATRARGRLFLPSSLPKQTKPPTRQQQQQREQQQHKEQQQHEKQQQLEEEEQHEKQQQPEEEEQYEEEKQQQQELRREEAPALYRQVPEDKPEQKPRTQSAKQLRRLQKQQQYEQKQQQQQDGQKQLRQQKEEEQQRTGEQPLLQEEQLATGHGKEQGEHDSEPASAPLCSYEGQSMDKVDGHTGHGCGTGQEYTSGARVVFLGHGADEQCAGYGRHRTRFVSGGMPALSSELALDVRRMWLRNLGRDDRLVADWGREGRHPFLDENLMLGLLKDVPLWSIADLTLPPGVGDKLVLRSALLKLGFPQAAIRVKRAIQFGTRLGKLSNVREFGSNRAANKLAAGSVDISTLSSASRQP